MNRAALQSLILEVINEDDSTTTNYFNQIAEELSRIEQRYSIDAGEFSNLNDLIYQYADTKYSEGYDSGLEHGRQSNDSEPRTSGLVGDPQ